MGCGSCEAHVKNVILKNIKAKKVIASHIKNLLIVITELNLVEDDFKKILDPTGYIVTSFERTAAVKTLFSWK